jgi:triosephosphate isomerase (TIM)
MRKKMIGANWKMNLTCDQARSLFTEYKNNLSSPKNVDVAVFPPQAFLAMFDPCSAFQLGAQNAFGPQLHGAFTGETSLLQLQDLGITSVLIGHSERRQYFHETDEFLVQKAIAALNLGFTVFFCCGESDETRKAGDALNFVAGQLSSIIKSLNTKDLSNLVIAYEPIWAIGTGKIPSLKDIEEMHGFIRKTLTTNFQHAAQEVRIIYGGSCNAENAKEIFSLPNVDGGLIGGASLQWSSFEKIIAGA